ncbi:KH domain-containing protein, partial [Methanothrix sp.]
MNIKIPSDRIGAVIGPNGETKRYLEERCSVSLDIDSESGAVTVTSQGDALDAMRAIDVLRAIARGFSP